MQRSGIPSRKMLVRAVAAALAVPSAAFAGTIAADGVTCTLANAINSANADSAIGGCTTGSGVDTIQIAPPTGITGSLPAVITDINFVGSGISPIIDGGGHQIFRIGDETHAPTVTFSQLIIAGGSAQGGGASGGGGAGAGMGGAIFIYDGTVSIDLSTLSENGATGGTTSNFVAPHTGGGGGGGVFGVGGTGAATNESTGGPGGTGGAFGGGGGGGGNTYTGEVGGGNGGDGGGTFPGSGGVVFPSPAFPSDGGFGGGGGGGAAPGDQTPSQAGASGGFGGGGGGGGGSGASANFDSPGPGGNGGFGGGGGAGGSANAAQGAAGSLGGFGGGGGSPGYGTSYGAPGEGGFGGGNTLEGGGGGGAGFGGAIFIRSGHLDVTNTQIAANGAQHGNGPGGAGLAKGAGIFAVNTLVNPNGNNQGMPTTLPQVTGCAVSFAFNNTADAGTSNRDNVDVYGVDRLGLTLACGDRIFADEFDNP